MCLTDCGILGMVGITCAAVFSLALCSRRAVTCCGRGSAHENCSCSAQNQYFRCVLVPVRDPAPVLEYHLCIFIVIIQVGGGTAKLILLAPFLCLVNPSVTCTQQDQSIWSEAAVLH